jgi:O-antigen/teichoic acid export membrane protein
MRNTRPRREASRVPLGRQAARSGAVVAAGRVLQGVVSLASVAILARLLTPSDFGVFAMVLPVALIVGMTLNRGLHVAVMHEERLRPGQVSGLFWIAQRFNVVLLGSMAAAAPLLAMAYRDSRVTVVALLWTAALTFQALGAFPEALLKRELKFGVLAAIELGAMLLGVGAAICAAAAGWTNVALVMQVLVWNAGRCIGANIGARWMPSRPARHLDVDPVIERLVAYGSDFGLARAVYWIGRQFDRMVVGYVGGAASLGFYDGARRWSWYPFQELFLSLTDVVVASLSRARHDAERFREYCRRGFTAFLALPLPAIAFVGLEAELVVRVLLGEQWLDAVPLVRIMSVAAMFDSVGRLTNWLYVAEGHTRRQLYWSVVSSGLTVAAVIGAAPHGAIGVTMAFAAVTAALALPGIAYCLGVSVLSTRDFLRAVWRPVVASIVAGAAWVGLREHLARPTATAVELVVAALAFAVIYIVAWVVLPGGRRATREGVQLARAIVPAGR